MANLFRCGGSGNSGGGGGYALNNVATLNVESTTDGSGVIKLWATDTPSSETYGSVTVDYDNSKVYMSELSYPQSDKDGELLCTLTSEYTSDNPLSKTMELGKNYYLSLFSYSNYGSTNLSKLSNGNASPSRMLTLFDYDNNVGTDKITEMYAMIDTYVSSRRSSYNYVYLTNGTKNTYSSYYTSTTLASVPINNDICRIYASSYISRYTTMLLHIESDSSFSNVSFSGSRTYQYAGDIILVGLGVSKDNPTSYASADFKGSGSFNYDLSIGESVTDVWVKLYLHSYSSNTVELTINKIVLS